MELQNEQKKKRSMPARVARFTLGLIIVLVLLAGALSALLYVYRDEVKSAILGEINKNLEAEVRIRPDDIDLTILSTFPDCSIQFSDLLMLEALQKKKRDTLLFARRLNLHFNIKDLWHGNYNIQALKLKDARCKPAVAKDGSNNFTFWESDTVTTADKLSFRLELVSLENVSVLYRDRESQVSAAFNIRKLRLGGEFSDTEYELQTSGKVLIQELSQGRSRLLRDKGLRFELGMNVKNDVYTFNRSDISLNELSASLKGAFRYKEKLENLEIAFSASDPDIGSLLSLLPAQYAQRIEDYKSKGDFYARGDIRYSGSRAYSIVSDFGISNGTITYKPNGTEASNVQLLGSVYMSADSSRLSLSSLALQLGEDRLGGRCTISNFSDPRIDLEANASLSLQNLQAFWPIDTLTSISGKVDLELRLAGLAADLGNRSFTEKVKIGLRAGVKGLEARFKGDETTYSVETCTLMADNSDVEVRDLRLKRGTSDLELNGTIPGLFSYLTNNKATLVIRGRLQSSKIRVEDFIGDRQSAAVPNNDPLIPAGISFILDADIKKFTFGKFIAEDISGDLEVRDQKAIVNEMKFRTMDGEADINAFADNSKGHLDVVVQSNLKDINIRSLFAQMNNFGQATLCDKHVKGILTAAIDFSGRWSNALESDPSSVYASSEMRIVRGELIGFQPLLSLSRFIDVKELQRIAFPLLQSKITIKNGAVIVPHTVVKNSVLDIDFHGTHYFDNRIDYHMRLLISELLAKKRKKADDEFGPVANDPENRRSAFILMTGTVDNPVIRYDKQGLRDKIREDIRQEKQNVKQIIRDEISSFRKGDDDGLEGSENTAPAIEAPAKPRTAPKTVQLKKKEEEDDF